MPLLLLLLLLRFVFFCSFVGSLAIDSVIWFVYFGEMNNRFISILRQIYQTVNSNK